MMSVLSYVIFIFSFNKIQILIESAIIRTIALTENGILKEINILFIS